MKKINKNNTGTYNYSKPMTYIYNSPDINNQNDKNKPIYYCNENITQIKDDINEIKIMQNKILSLIENTKPKEIINEINNKKEIEKEDENEINKSMNEISKENEFIREEISKLKKKEEESKKIIESNSKDIEFLKNEIKLLKEKYNNYSLNSKKEEKEEKKEGKEEKEERKILGGSLIKFDTPGGDENIQNSGNNEENNIINQNNINSEIIFREKNQQRNQITTSNAAFFESPIDFSSENFSKNK